MARRTLRGAPFLLLITLLTMAFSLSAAASTAAQSPDVGSALRLVFRGCDDGIDPRETPEACTTVLDAPPDAMLGTAPDYVEDLATVPRQDDGTYLIDMPSGQAIDLSGFAPTDYNYFMFSGVDEQRRWASSVTLERGETRDVTVYYWNDAEGLIEPAENTVRISLRGCPDGVDPTAEARACTTVVDAPEAFEVHALDSSLIEGDQPIGVSRLPRHDDGVYTLGNLAAYTQVTLTDPDPEALGYDAFLITGDIEETTDRGATAYLVRGETREITVYYYHSDTGTLRVTVRGCAAGADPQVSLAECTEPVDIGENAVVYPRKTEDYTTIADKPRDRHGAYVIEGLDADVAYYIGRLDTRAYRDVFITGRTESGLVGPVIEVTPGQITEIGIYYYNPTEWKSTTGTIRIAVLSCPARVTPLANSGLAMVSSLDEWARKRP